MRAIALQILVSFLLSWIAIFLLPNSLHAQDYRYTDDQGKTHYTDNLHSIPPQYRDQVQELEQSISRQAPPPEAEEEAPPPSEVTGIEPAWTLEYLEALRTDPNAIANLFQQYGATLIILGIAYVLYWCLCLQFIATKVSSSLALLAWLPICWPWVFLSIADLPLLLAVPWILLPFFLQFLPGGAFMSSFILYGIWILICLRMATQRDKSLFWGILLLFPGLNLIALGYLAFSE